MRGCNKTNYHYTVINENTGERKLYMTIKEISNEFNFTEQTRIIWIIYHLNLFFINIFKFIECFKTFSFPFKFFYSRDRSNSFTRTY